MIFVVLRSGRVLQYNTAMHVDSSQTGFVTIRKESGNPHFQAIIPWDMIERIENGPPCRVRRAKAAPKRADY